MGISSKLFFDNDTDNQTLHQRITLNNEQLEEQAERWNELAEYLVDTLRADSGYPMGTWLQGSYKYGTQIRPVNAHESCDIDLGLYFCWEDSRDNGDFSAKELKQMVQNALEAFAEENPDEIENVSEPKTRCARIHYKNKFHIDVPVYHLNPQTDERSLATESGEWEESDPKAIYTWFKEQFDEAQRPKVRRLIRYLKCWAGLKFQTEKRPSSIMLTVMAVNALHDLGINNLGADDEAFAAMAASILSQIDSDGCIYIENPVNIQEDLCRLENDDAQAFYDKLKDLVTNSSNAVAQTDSAAAWSLWEVIFEHIFPLPSSWQQQVSKNALVTMMKPEVRVRAVQNSTSKVFEGMNGIGPIPKGCDITFEVTNPQILPPGSQICWTVRNDGAEAESVNDLGHQNLKPGLSAQEKSAYIGTHSMDCAVRVNGLTISLRRIEVKIAGIQLPKITKPKRDYLRLRANR